MMTCDWLWCEILCDAIGTSVFVTTGVAWTIGTEWTATTGDEWTATTGAVWIAWSVFTTGLLLRITWLII